MDGRAACSHHRHRRPGRLVPLRAPARAWLRGRRRRSPAGRRPPGPRERARPRECRRGRPARSRLARPRASRCRATRGVQPRRPVVRAALVGRTRSDGRVRGRRSDVAPRGDPRGGSVDSPLPGLLERDLRRSRVLAPDRGRRRYGRSPRTASRRPMPISSPTATGAATACSRAAGSSTTTSRRDGRSTSSRAKWRRQRRRSRSAWRPSSCSAISIRAATGATPRTMSRRCG